MSMDQSMGASASLVNEYIGWLARTHFCEKDNMRH